MNKNIILACIITCTSSTGYALDTEEVLARYRAVQEAHSIPSEEQHAHSVLPACFDMLQNLAQIVLDPTNPSVVGPNTIFILQDIAAIVHELMHNQPTPNAQTAKLAQEMSENISSIKDTIERYIAHYEQHAATRSASSADAEQQKKDADMIIAQVITITQSIGCIVKDPHNPVLVTEEVARIVSSLIQLGLYAKEQHDAHA